MSTSHHRSCPRWAGSTAACTCGGIRQRKEAVDIHPQNIQTMLTLVQCWQADHATWKEAFKGPDGTTFPPAWPLTYAETAGLIVWLMERQAKPEPTVAAVGNGAQ